MCNLSFTVIQSETVLDKDYHLLIALLFTSFQTMTPPCFREKWPSEMGSSNLAHETAFLAYTGHTVLTVTYRPIVNRKIRLNVYMPS
jgi:hypothetical protein